MKNTFLLVLTIGLFTACGRSEKTQETQPPAKTDSVATATPTPRDCKTVVDASKLGKSDVYQESGKSIRVTLTLAQDTSSTETSGGCYFNNTVTVLATKKSGSQLFKRTLLKDDLLYFIKSDEVVERSVLKTVSYKPTFNGQRYINLIMRVVDPISQKTADYTLFMNYFGEIVKVK